MEPYNEDPFSLVLLAALLGGYLGEWEQLDAFVEYEIINRYRLSPKNREAFMEVLDQARRRRIERGIGRFFGIPEIASREAFEELVREMRSLLDDQERLFSRLRDDQGFSERLVRETQRELGSLQREQHHRLELQVRELQQTLDRSLQAHNEILTQHLQANEQILTRHLQAYEQILTQQSLTSWFMESGKGEDALHLPLLRAIPVRIFIGDPVPPRPELEKIIQAVTAFVSGMGFQIGVALPEEKGSWWKSFFFRARKLLTSQEVQRRTAVAEAVLKAHMLDKPQAEANKAQAEGAAALISSLANVRNACVQAGTILIVKRTSPDGESLMWVRTLTINEVRALEENQGMLRRPDSILEWLQDVCLSANHSEVRTTDSGAGTLRKIADGNRSNDQ